MTTPQTLKGFRDFYPEQMAFQSWFYQKIREVSESFGFQQYEGPTVEPLELYAAKSGDELVKKQAFTFQDKSGKTVALRPEMTPTLARMIAQKSGSLIFPLKWYTYGRRFRYEQPQKGRGREFFQWDIDILGTDSYLADAEVIIIAATFYQKLGLTPNEVKIKINDRQYLQQKLASAGVPENLVLPLFKIIDKKNKVDLKTFQQMLEEIGLSSPQITNLMQILSDRDGFRNSSWLTGILDLIKNAGLAEFVEFDPSIVRGLDYYTRTVFEGWDVKSQFRSIWGGGRYDNLTQNVGAKQKIPGVGFAMGDMVIEEILRSSSKYPDLPVNKTQVLVTILSEELRDKSIELSIKLRRGKVAVELYPDDQTKLDKQLKYAAQKGIPYVAVIGPEEVAKDMVTLKNMSTGEQKQLPADKLIESVAQN